MRNNIDKKTLSFLTICLHNCVPGSTNAETLNSAKDTNKHANNISNIKYVVIEKRNKFLVADNGTDEGKVSNVNLTAAGKKVMSILILNTISFIHQ